MIQSKKEVPMYCYYCDRNGASVPAIAICQRCGGAVCRQHIRELHSTGSPFSAAGPIPSRIEHICQNCLAGRWDLHGPPSTKAAKRAAQSSDDLPDAVVAVRSAEEWLRRTQRTPHTPGRNRWRSLWRRLVHPFMPGQTVGIPNNNRDGESDDRFDIHGCIG
jgi:hypothetical protein